jgi:hypothetical protein
MMMDNQRNQNRQKQDKKPAYDQNLTSNETGNTNNSFLGQMGHEQEGKTESFQGNWSGNYGNGYTGNVNNSMNSENEDFNKQASSQEGANIGNGLNSDEDDIISAGQHVDDIGLGDEGTTGGKAGENSNRTKGNTAASSSNAAKTSAQGDVMPPDNNDNRDDIIGDEGPGLVTSGDVAAMTGQNIDDLDLPTAADVAGWRQDAGTIGQDSADKEGVDTGERNTVSENSGEATTGRADTEGGFGQYPNSGDLGQVDPGQQNYVEDQDTRQAFRAGDYKTSQERDPEEGSNKYNPQKTNATDKGSPDPESSDNA